MSFNSLNIIGPLDKMRIDNGADGLKAYYHELIRNSREKAINVINDENSSFTSLFILNSEIEEFEIYNNLNTRNKLALQITNKVLQNEKNSLLNEYSLLDYIQISHSALKWILETGSLDDGLNNQYDEVLDIAAIFLTKLYRDETVLPIISDMIFKRHRKGLFFHDLVWAFFECHAPHSLILIANNLLSSNPQDLELSSKLLSFIPSIDINKDKQKQYLSFIKWIEENNLFLYYTGESLQQMSNPSPYTVVLEAKYLWKIVCIETGKTIDPFTQEEYKLLDIFNKLDNNQKLLLADFSFMLHKKDMYWWNNWLHYPIAEQIKYARIGGVY